MAYTVDELKTLYATAIGDASRAGKDKHVDIMAAIAFGESSGNPSAKNPTSSASGLWQIMWSVWRKNDKVHALTGGQQSKLFDPVINAKVAAIVYQEQGYTAWEVYNNGSYKQYLSGDPSADSLGVVGGVVGGKVSSTVNGWVSPLTDWANRITKVTGLSVAGGLAIILGVALLISQSKAAKGIVGVGVSASPLGKVAKTVAK